MKRFRSPLLCTPLVVAASAVLVTGCRHRAPVPTGEAGGAGAPIEVPAGGAEQDEPQTAPQKSPVQVSLVTDKPTYKQGETIKFTVVAVNEGAEPTTVVFNNGMLFDVEATREGEAKPTWRWSTGRMFTMMVRRETLAPKAEKRYAGTWNGKTVDADGTVGAAVPASRYVLRGKLAIAGNVYAPPVTVEITG